VILCKTGVEAFYKLHIITKIIVISIRINFNSLIANRSDDTHTKTKIYCKPFILVK
jgi:hypothetical protein